MTFDSADALIARVNAQVVEAQERADRARQLRIGVDEVRGKASSPRNEVEVAVDSSGRLTNLQLTDSALEYRASDLAALIVKTAQAAHRKAGEQVIGLAADAFGEDSDVVTRVRGELAERVPEEESSIGYDRDKA